MDLKDRFLKYVSFDTQSDESSQTFPSTEKQLVLLNYLKEELQTIGLEDVSMDEHGYVMATLPATKGKENVPTIGFISHVDTSPDMSGANIKPHIIEKYDGRDIMLGNNACTGFVGKTVIMHGKAAHAAAAPHMGVNALNAASLGMSALGMVRETFQEKDCIRVHPFFKKGGEVINVVPSEVIVDMMVRANNHPAIEATSEKVDNCFKGAAMAIGCEAEIINAQGYLPCPEREPDQVMWDAAAALGDDVKVVPIQTGVCNTASTDVGDLFAVMPVLNFTFGGSTGALHSKDFAITDRKVAHILPAKMMALLAYRLLKDGGVEAQKIIDGYKADFTKEEYKEYVRNFSA